jgi:hypothetical protein
VADDAGRACEWTGTDGKGCCATPLEACATCDEARAAKGLPPLACAHAPATAAPAPPPGVQVLRRVRVLRLMLPEQRRGGGRRVERRAACSRPPGHRHLAGRF